jgi:pimeloyl-ACP methyl ester carboxylesterase
MTTLKRIVAAISLVALLWVGGIYESIGERLDLRRMPRVGQPIDVGGRTLSLSCLGHGTPTVILDSGGTSPGYSNLPLQRVLAAETTTCWFDRAGLGWSDPSPIPQTSAAIAEDLHELLRAAERPPPVILIGQSFSGFNVRVFAKKYPNDVAGIVLLDAVREDQQQYEPRALLSPFNRLPSFVRAGLCRAQPFAARVGVIRALATISREPPTPPGFTRAEAAILATLRNQPKAFVVSAECDAWQLSAAEARAAGTLGNTPLIVLTAGTPMTVGDPAADREIVASHQIWLHQLQPRLAALSTNGRQVIVEHCRHGIASDAPDSVVEAIHEILSSGTR